MQWVRIYNAPGYRSYVDIEQCNAVFANAVSGSSPVEWAIYATRVSLGDARLDLGSWETQEEANDALTRFVESL